MCCYYRLPWPHQMCSNSTCPVSSTYWGTVRVEGKEEAVRAGGEEKKRENEEGKGESMRLEVDSDWFWEVFCCMGPQCS